MTDLDHIIQAIIADPKSDDLRRIYADHLDEAGEPERAEFVRVQLELASLDNGDWRQEATAGKWGRGDDVLAKRGQRIHELSQAEKRLLAANPQWGADLAIIWHDAAARPGVEHGHSGCASPNGDGPIRWDWSRGLVSCFICRMAQWLPKGAEVAMICPLEYVTLFDKNPMQEEGRLDSGRVWHSWHAGPGWGSSVLPIQLWSFLRGGIQRGSNSVSFSTAAAARDSLSDACIRWAKSQVPK